MNLEDLPGPTLRQFIRKATFLAMKTDNRRRSTENAMSHRDSVSCRCALIPVTAERRSRFASGRRVQVEQGLVQSVESGHECNSGDEIVTTSSSGTGTAIAPTQPGAGTIGAIVHSWGAAG